MKEIILFIKKVIELYLVQKIIIIKKNKIEKMETLKMATIIKLSNRENQVCNLLISGTTTSGIAKVLNIKSNTVSTIKKSIFYKTKATNIIELYEIYKQG